MNARPSLSAAAATLGKKGGSARSDRKTEACRRNGALAPPPPHVEAAGDWHIVRYSGNPKAFFGEGPRPLPSVPRGPWRGAKRATDALDRYLLQLEDQAGSFVACYHIRVIGPFRTKREALANR